MRVFLALPTYDETIYVNTMMTALNAVPRPSDIEVCLEPGSGSLLPRVFNRLLATAVSRGYERFVMLHADIAAEPGWLTKMLAIQDQHDADIVSVVSPIKDARQLTSTCYYDAEDALHILTLQECCDKLPLVFDVSAPWLQEQGAKVLGVNTGLMLMRLDRPWLKQWSGFRIISDIQWGGEQIHCHVVSEDWQMCRELAQLEQPPKIVATTAVQMHHRGMMVWGNAVERPASEVALEQSPQPLSLVQILEFELGSECNLGKIHTKCPNLHSKRYGTLDTSRELDDETIVRCATDAYRDLGFSGLVGWIYYNEPLLQQDRMFDLMKQIRGEVPQARFMLWTNGYLIPEECRHYDQFEQIIISGYSSSSRRGYERLRAKHIQAHYRHNAQLDSRLVQIEPMDVEAPCLRPFVEFIVDNHGNTHFCCYDWQGQGSWGNVLHDDMATLAQRWFSLLPSIAGAKMGQQAPDVCRQCGHRWNQYQQHDEATVKRAKAWRERLVGA